MLRSTKVPLFAEASAATIQHLQCCATAERQQQQQQHASRRAAAQQPQALCVSITATQNELFTENVFHLLGLPWAVTVLRCWGKIRVYEITVNAKGPDRNKTTIVERGILGPLRWLLSSRTFGSISESSDDRNRT
jgi:hypothetical protein